MSTTKPYSDNFSGPEVKPLKVEYDVIAAESCDALKNLVNIELQRTDCTVRLAGGVSFSETFYPGEIFPRYLLMQALTRYHL